MNTKRRILLLALVAFVGTLAACESPTVPPIPKSDDEDDPPPEENGEQTGFLQFRDAPLILA